MNLQTKLRINHWTAVKSVALLENNVVYNTEKVDEHRETAISTITLTPTHDDNRALYSCEAVHKALGTPIDEAHFWLNGYVNKQNCCIWSEANPQVYVKTPLHPEKLTVWCALWAGGILLQKR
ncbi:hypothetical protein TNCV_3164161 [Trichonephila clavipes]|nr:hypothetical protein TNCV_3164161 [Trichonephila clavipes]